MSRDARAGVARLLVVRVDDIGDVVLLSRDLRSLVVVRSEDPRLALPPTEAPADPVSARPAAA